MSPSYTRVYPLVVGRGAGGVIEDVDGNRFLDFTAGIAVTATGHCHPEVVAAIQDQAAELIHMCGTDFYYARRSTSPSGWRGWPPGRRRRGCSSPTAGPRRSRRRSSSPAGTPGGRGRRVLRGVPRPDLRGDVAVRVRSRPPPRLLAAGAGHPPRPVPATSEQRPTPCSQDGLPARTRWRRSSSSRSRARAGYLVPPAGCLPALRALCDRHGILLVVDEVQIGHGPHGQDVRGRALGRRAGHHLPREGDRQRDAARGDHRQGRRDGLAAAAATPARSAATRWPARRPSPRSDVDPRIEIPPQRPCRGNRLAKGLPRTSRTSLSDRQARFAARADARDGDPVRHRPPRPGTRDRDHRRGVPSRDCSCCLAGLSTVRFLPHHSV